MRKDAQVLLGKADLPTEPARNTGGLVSLVIILMSTITILFPNFLSNKTQLIIYMIASFILPLVTAFLIRKKVWSPASVQQVIEEVTAEASQLKKLPIPRNETPKLL